MVSIRDSRRAIWLALGLCLVALVIVTVVADSRKVPGNEAVKQHVEDGERLIFKRQATSSTAKPTKRPKKTTKNPSTTAKGKSTTGNPKSTTTTGKPTTGGPKTTPGTGRPTGDPKTTTTTTTTGKPTKSGTTTVEPLDPTKKRYLKHAERVALDHLVAGVYNWAKVLKQNGGKPLSMDGAGEFFLLLKENVEKKLHPDFQPEKLIKHFLETIDPKEV